MLVLGVGALTIGVARRRELGSLCGVWLLVVSYGLLLVGWGATTLEDAVVWPMLDWIEHAANAGGAVLFAIWCWNAPEQRRGAR